MSSPSANPLVSIILPTHNSADYIVDSVRSVLAQTYQNWELFILDDASSDNTEQLVQPFLNDPRISYRYLDKQKSVYAVRNIGLSLCQGEFITFLDSDDLHVPEFLSTGLEHLLRHPELKAVYGFYSSINEKNEDIPNFGPSLVPKADGTMALPEQYSHAWQNILLGDFCALLQSTIFRKSVFQELGKFNEKVTHAVDSEYFYRLLLSSPNALEALPFYAIRYRIHSGSLTKSAKHIDKLLHSRLALADWLFSVDNLPAEVACLKEKYYSQVFFGVIRLQLNQSRNATARQIVLQAFKHPYISRLFFFRKFSLIFLQSLIPPNLYLVLANVYRSLRFSLNASSKPVTS
jgi:glycosyltransferase involved in cell wall biosynthesis